MTNHVQDAFRRAAQRGGPLFAHYDAFARDSFTLRDRLNDTIDPRIHHVFSAPGAQRWSDIDEDAQAVHEQLTREQMKTNHGTGRLLFTLRGLGIITLFTDWDGDKPDYLRDHKGDWYIVRNILGRDALAASVRFEVRRRVGEPPDVGRDIP